jgi:hypothetical protein
MSNPEDKPPAKKQPPERGAVSYDSRGNAVWQWAVDSGRHLIASTSHLLKRLEVPGLKLEEEASSQERKSIAKPGQAAEPTGSVGYDPYGHKRVATPTPPRPRPAATKPAAGLPPRRSWWQRLFRRD